MRLIGYRMGLRDGCAVHRGRHFRQRVEQIVYPELEQIGMPGSRFAHVSARLLGGLRPVNLIAGHRERRDTARHAQTTVGP